MHRARVALTLCLLAAFLPAGAAAKRQVRSAPLGFGAPVLVDRQLAGGEPTVAYALKSHLLIYTAHEGTTHIFSSALPGAPAESGAWVGSYRNQVNIWTSANNGATWQRVTALAGFFDNPLINQGFSDPDLTQDAALNIYNTGIDLVNDALFSSQDGGRSWPTGTIQCHAGDRPWLAGGKAGEVFLSTDTNEAGHEVFHSTNAGASCSANGIPDNGTAAGGESYTGTGKLFYDARRGQLIDPVFYSRHGVVSGIGVGILRHASTAFGNPAAKFVPVRIARTTAYAHWPSLAIDAAGNYYMVWDTDARQPSSSGGCNGLTFTGSEAFPGPGNARTALANRIMMSVSTDGGRHWSRPRTVAYFPGHRLLWPWITAGSAGNVGVVWYQYDRLTDPDCGTGNVSVMAARILGATGRRLRETVVNASGRPIHAGAICAGGTTCVVTAGISGEDRRLGDYFTVATDGRGCILIATGDTTLTDPITHQPSPISHPVFLRQNRGLGLTGRSCAVGRAATSVVSDAQPTPVTPQPLSP